MNREIKIFGSYFLDFLDSIDEKARIKIDYGLQLLKTQKRLSTKFVKIIRDGLYELRISFSGNIYRVFFIFDEGQIVVLFNGFQKKSQKTPKKEIDKAIRIMEEYYEYKKNSKLR